MSDEFSISTGVKRISVKNEFGEVCGEVSFNPKDTVFVERFFELIGEFKTKIDELHDRSKELEKESG